MTQHPPEIPQTWLVLCQGGAQGGSSKAGRLGRCVLPSKLGQAPVNAAEGSTMLTAKVFTLLGRLALLHLPCSHARSLSLSACSGPIPKDCTPPGGLGGHIPCISPLGSMQGPCGGRREKSAGFSQAHLVQHPPEDTAILSGTSPQATRGVPGKWFL